MLAPELVCFLLGIREGRDIERSLASGSQILCKGRAIGAEYCRRLHIGGVLERVERILSRLWIIENERRNAIGRDDLRLRRQGMDQSLAERNLVVGEERGSGKQQRGAA